jgi:ribosomal-protein-alanine N-acetyltransferase
LGFGDRSSAFCLPVDTPAHESYNPAMTGPEFPTIETRRLVLRPWELSDAPAIYAYQADAEIYRYMRPEPPASPDAVKESIGQWLELRAEVRSPNWVIVLKERSCVVGLIGLGHVNREHSGAWLTYEVAHESWGKGIATEAVRAVLSYGFDTMGLNRIGAYCWQGNLASQRVLEKAGMRYEGTLRQIRFAKGAYRDMRYYSVLAEEWRARPGTSGSHVDSAGVS